MGEQTWKVLVVDDDASIVDLMRDFLESDRFGVNAAADAAGAAEVLDREAVDCVLLDVMLPGRSGFELCRQIRAQRDLPILFFSARESDVDKIRGLGLGGDDYIVKSASPAEVIARLKAVQRRYEAHEAASHAQLDFGEENDWTVSTLTQAVQSVVPMSRSSVWRTLQQNALHPHRVQMWLYSIDPAFRDKVNAIVSIYENPPEDAVVLCIDEKTGIQATKEEPYWTPA